MPTIVFGAAASAAEEMLLLMMHPDDEGIRARDLTIGKLDKFTRDPGARPVELDRERMRLLLNAPSLSTIKENQQRCLMQGFMAGRVLACLYICDRFREAHPYFVPSMNRAIFVSMYQAKAGATFGKRFPLPRAEGTIRAAWRKYASVAPYWAAASMGSLGYGFAPERELFGPKFGDFLSVSAALHRFGTTFVPDGVSPAVTVLDLKTAWAPPPDIAPRSLVSDRVPDILKGILQKYRAPKK